MEKSKNEIYIDISKDIIPHLAAKIGKLECENTVLKIENGKLKEKVAKLSTGK